MTVTLLVSLVSVTPVLDNVNVNLMWSVFNVISVIFTRTTTAVEKAAIHVTVALLGHSVTIVMWYVSFLISY